MISEMARDLLNEYNLLTRKTGKTEVEPGSYTPAYFEACDKEIEAGNKVITYIATIEAENVALKERLAAYEAGYDPAERMPDDSDDVFVKANDGRSYYAVYDCPSDDSIARFIVLPFGNSTPVFSINDITRWFPLPGKGGEA